MQSIKSNHGRSTFWAYQRWVCHRWCVSDWWMWRKCTGPFLQRLVGCLLAWLVTIGVKLFGCGLGGLMTHWTATVLGCGWRRIHGAGEITERPINGQRTQTPPTQWSEYCKWASLLVGISRDADSSYRELTTRQNDWWLNHFDVRLEDGETLADHWSFGVQTWHIQLLVFLVRCTLGRLGSTMGMPIISKPSKLGEPDLVPSATSPPARVYVPVMCAALLHN